MDIHRCRFVSYPPSTINALAFSHSHISKGQKTSAPRLAVGRANGDIEIWNPLKGSWLQEIIIRGGKDRSIDELVWTQDPNEEDANGRTIIGKSRLFSIGYTTTVTEWDLEKGRPLRQANGNHGEIWCLAAQPAPPSTKKDVNGSSTPVESQKLISGCTDGALVLYSTADEDLQLQRVLVRPSVKKAKIISVAFQDRNNVIAGCTDSTIRVYDIRNGSTIRIMSLGAGPAGGLKETIVWSVKALPNGDIISAISTGQLCIFDGKNYTLKQRITGHKQDVLSLATSFDGSMIFSGGMDRRTVVYKQVGKGKGRWAEVAHRRYHIHDVKTMASLECKGMSVVVSGGPDASPTVVPLSQFGMENQRALPFLPQEPIIRSSPKKRLIMSWWDREVNIWRLGRPAKPTHKDSEEQAAQNRKLVARVMIKGEAGITSTALSPDGNILAVATSEDIKIFQLKGRTSEEGDGLKVSKITPPSDFSLGARLIQFSPDGKWICMIREDSRVILARITLEGKSASSITITPQLTKLERIDRKIEKHITLGGLGNYDRTITQIAFSSKSNILAVSDLAGYLDTWILSGREDLSQSISNVEAASSSEPAESDEEETKAVQIFGQYWTRNPSASLLPKLPSAPVILSFRPSTSQHESNDPIPHATRNTPHPISHNLPSGEDRLLIVTATSDVHEFSVLEGALTPWSRRNPTTRFPDEFRQIIDQSRGVFWDVSAGKERLWLYGVGWLWMFDLSRDFPEEARNGNLALTNGYLEKGKKRKREGGKVAMSGAGSTIPDSKLDTGIGRKIQRVIHEEIDETKSIAFSRPENDDTMDMDDDEDLEPLRGKEVARSEEETDGKPHSWRTFKYRPILGMAILGETNQGLEAVIAERPIWDAELAPSRRFGGPIDLIDLRRRDNYFCTEIFLLYDCTALHRILLRDQHTTTSKARPNHPLHLTQPAAHTSYHPRFVPSLGLALFCT
ncbi:hypothetical protein B7494_g8424, partial [Chlorociboria aeruginascens]